MEDATLVYFVLSSIFLLIVSSRLFFNSKTTHKNLPPSPPCVPIFGHLHLIKPLLHRFLFELSEKYGPIFSLKFGSRLVVVVSSSLAAEECFTKNDIVLANRPESTRGKYIGYNYTSMVDARYGDHWRNLRRISATEIFSPTRLNLFADVRRDEIRLLLKKLSKNSIRDFAQLEIRSALSDFTFNNIVRMVSGKRYFGENVVHGDEEEARQFREVISKVFEYGGTNNPGDFLPILNWTYGGYEKKVKMISKKMDGLLQKLINENRGKHEGNTMIDHLLSLQKSQPSYYSDQIIKGLIMVLIVAGTDTTAITIEWALSSLLNYPNMLKKAKDELNAKLGQEILIDESHISNLPYLQNIISETLRLYPAAPLLAPHMASEDCTIDEYNIPHDTMVLINAWAIHRDPKLWDDPLVFKPERFEGIYTSQNTFKYLPFGMGRRVCPGVSLAQRFLFLVLGSLIQCFDWKRVGEEEIDMAEGPGLTMPKAQPLVAMCRARPIMKKVLAEDT